MLFDAVAALLRRIWYRFFDCPHMFARPMYGYERFCPDCRKVVRGLGRVN
jgi:hypothetical protein